MSAMPDVTQEKITADMEFVVIACDGVWDCISSQNACTYVGQAMKKKKAKDRLSTVCEDLVDSLVAKELEGYGTDNMTCIVVEFKK